MATVRDASDNSPISPGTDNSYDKVQRNNAGSPVGSVTPAYVGELIVDTTNFIVWRANGTANTAWEPVDREA